MSGPFSIFGTSVVASIADTTGLYSNTSPVWVIDWDAKLDCASSWDATKLFISLIDPIFNPDPCIGELTYWVSPVVGSNKNNWLVLGSTKYWASCLVIIFWLVIGIVFTLFILLLSSLLAINSFIDLFTKSWNTA